jgi:hypothetical protein
VSALRFVLAARSPTAAKFSPLVGALIGALGGAVYWLAAQIWPSSVAVILCMTFTAALVWGKPGTLPASRFVLMGPLFCLLIKYNALMALSAAKLPFAAPANVPLGLIMVCAHAASFALMIAVMAVRPLRENAKVGGASLSIALLAGILPAALLGIPGLTGLAAAIIAILGLIAYLKLMGASAADGTLDLAQLLAEVSFYLGALATWRYV